MKDRIRRSLPKYATGVQFEFVFDVVKQYALYLFPGISANPPSDARQQPAIGQKLQGH